MSVAPGTRLGPYEILAPIGAGGMGEVFRARDTRLERSVAIKVLPSEFASNTSLKQRFEREARSISQLNHPHICTLHDVGSHDGVEYLVMELIEGETLADRIARGPLPLPEVLKYGAQIAEALHVAHRAGIVHRDLKPGNIMITKSGAKLLDFGLARGSAISHSTSISGRGEGSADRGVTEDATAYKPLTAEGTILGTFQYMAPEQLEGEEADARTDIFALGTVLYEMVTGRRAFEGKTKTSLIAAIVDRDPTPISQLQPLTPPIFEHIVQKCLEKDRDSRWQSAYDVADELRWISTSTHALPLARRGTRRSFVPWAVAAVAVAVAAVTTFIAIQARRSVAHREPLRVALIPPAELRDVGDVAISPDGRFVALTGTSSDGRHQIWLRPLSSSTAQPIAGSEGAFAPFWSPDSRAIAFFTNDKLKRVTIGATTSAPQIICEVRAGGGGSWSEKNVIIFSEDGVIRRVAAAGGKAVAVTRIDPSRRHSAHLFPSFLPDGEHFIYLADADRTEDHGLWVGSLDSAPPRLIAPAVISNPQYTAGYLLYVQRGSLMARAFDPKSLTASGDAVALGELVAGGGGHYYRYSAAANGTLTYQTANRESQLVWLDRDGKQLSATPLPFDAVGTTLSPDDRYALLEVVDAEQRNGDIWRFDLTRGVPSRFTFDPGWDYLPVWSPDGRDVIFGSNRGGLYHLYRKAAGGGGREELLSSSKVVVNPTSWSPDGKHVLANTFDSVSNSRMDIHVLPASGGKPVAIIGELPFFEHSGVFSPDGRWIAYCSDESGTQEVYVQPFPVTGAKWQISTGGAGEPRWHPSGKELFFRGSGDKFLAVEINPSGDFSVGAARTIFERRTKSMLGRSDYAISSDGTRVLVNAAAPGVSPLNIVMNWTSGMNE